MNLTFGPKKKGDRVPPRPQSTISHRPLYPGGITLYHRICICGILGIRQPTF